MERKVDDTIRNQVGLYRNPSLLESVKGGKGENEISQRRELPPGLPVPASLLQSTNSNLIAVRILCFLENKES